MLVESLAQRFADTFCGVETITYTPDFGQARVSCLENSLAAFIAYEFGDTEEGREIRLDVSNKRVEASVNSPASS